MSAYRFEGHERITIELDGFFEPTLELPHGLELDLVDGRARVSLFAFHVDSLRIVGMPLVRASYGELLWRIAVRRGEQRAWWVAACDLGAMGPAWAARRWVRYPVRKTRVEVTDRAVSLDGLGFELGEDGDPALVEQRDLLTSSLFQVLWGDDASGIVVKFAMTDTLGPRTVGSDVTGDHREGTEVAYTAAVSPRGCDLPREYPWYKKNRNFRRLTAMAFAQSSRRPIEGAVATLGVSDRVAFLRKTYAHLGVALIAFALIAGGMMRFMPEVSLKFSMWALRGRWTWLLVILAFMVVGYVAERLARSESSRPVQYLGLSIAVLAEGIILQPLLWLVLAKFGGDGFFAVITQSIIITLTILSVLH
jgi:hypothetical protein